MRDVYRLLQRPRIVVATISDDGVAARKREPGLMN